MGYHSCNSRDYRFYNLARDLATVSDCRYKFGAIIAYGNKRIGMGINIIKTHPIMRRYGNHCISVHAEINAILKARTDVNGCTMYIARDSVNPNSRPCAVCMSIIIESGIKCIVYHNGNSIVKERI